MIGNPLLRACRHEHSALAALAVLAALSSVLLACQGQAPAPVAPKGPTACARASDNMIAVLLAQLPKDRPPPTETADAYRNAIREHCEADGWSAEATQCLTAMNQLADAEPCAKLMTEDQQAALARAELAEVGAAPGGSGSGSGPP
jgi:hypothetical protein